MNSDIKQAYDDWQLASKKSSDLARKLFQPGSGYGDPGAEMQDLHLLSSARNEEDLFYRRYQELSACDSERRNYRLQVATWVVGFVVGVATVVDIVFRLLGLSK